MLNNADEILFRCSSLSHLMTNPKSKSETLSETTKTHLVDVFTREKYNRFEEINSKYLDKGNDVEEDSITVVSRITKDFYKKNEESLSNQFIKGTPDLFKGESITKAERIRDTKSSWSVFTFQRAISKPLDIKYYWQGQGYMALSGATKCNIDYCLNNTPYHIIEGELRKESYNHLNQDTPAWIEAQIIANHTYDLKTFNDYMVQRGVYSTDERVKYITLGFVEIPLKERHFTFEFDRNDDDICRLYTRIKECRQWMNENLFKTQQQLLKAI
jgi:hypothetical protein